MHSFSNFFRDESGASAAEYGLILALVAGVIAVAFSFLGTTIKSTVNTVAGNIALS